MRSTPLVTEIAEALAILSLTVVAIVICGVINTQIAARVCMEFFTIGLAENFELGDTTWFALKMGILNTWWLGLSMGVLLAVAARAGSRPRFRWQFFIRPMYGLVMIATVVAFAAGMLGYVAARNGALELYYSVAKQLEPAKRAAFMANQCAQISAYLTLGICGVFLCVWVWKKRAAVEAQLSENQT